MLKNTPLFLSKLEDIFVEAEYMLRYEKGSFKAGYCLLKDTKVVVVNKYLNTESRIQCLAELLKTMEIDQEKLSDKSKKIWQEIA
jgi:hypothetical protein